MIKRGTPLSTLLNIPTYYLLDPNQDDVDSADRDTQRFGLVSAICAVLLLLLLLLLLLMLLLPFRLACLGRSRQ